MCACVRVCVCSTVRYSLIQDEAFALWHTYWGVLYPEGSESRKIIEYFQDTYYLVNLVDNDYVQGNMLWAILDEVLVKLGRIDPPETT